MKSFKQELVGVLGYPVAENPSQAMVEAGFRSMGLDWRYLTLEVRPEALKDAVRGLVACGFRGWNCTIPHKVAVIETLDELTPAAQTIGAVNCVIVHEGRTLGDNTDGKGFLQSVQSVRSVKGISAVILGAGGAARAIAAELAIAGASSLTIVNRSVERGRSLAESIRDRTGARVDFVAWQGHYAIPEQTDLVVNATSIGLYPDVDAVVPIDFRSLSPGMVVCDVIPNPPRTHLVRTAEERGCTVLDGLGMLVNQGVIGIRLWTGQEPDPRVMRAALEEIFA